MIKAIRGGGGKGMRIATEENNFLEALESARTESQKAFGNSDVLLEKYVQNPRHVEVQIFADMYGNAVYLFERDCSVQRRHQKVIEEAPAPGLSEQVRKEIGESAVRAAKAVGYVGAGTVEFILDRKDNKFYFMEMNTRLQVEHPVTEAITGLDLVEWQLKISGGEKLPLRQEDLKINGHAFEARIYAENPRGGFLPGAGSLLHLRAPEKSEGTRVETGVRQGDEISVHYDPMIAKLVVWGENRRQALGNMIRKLTQYHIAGVETNIEFIKDLCRHPKFQAGDVHTGFIDENLQSLFPKLQVPHEVLAQGILAMILHADLAALEAGIHSKDPLSPFKTELGFRLNHSLIKRFQLIFNDIEYSIDVKHDQIEVYLMRINGLGPWIKVTGNLIPSGNGSELTSEVEDLKIKSRVFKSNNELHIFTNERTWKFTIPEPAYSKKLSKQFSGLAGAAVSPMPGVVDKIMVSKNDIVKKGDPLIVIVAMKMEHVIRAPSTGTVEEILCSVGSTVAKNRLLVKMSEP